jgi:hypothetical protein
MELKEMYKKKRMPFLALLVLLALLSCDGRQNAYKVGDRGPGGGFIFYDKGNSAGGWRYLEAAPDDQGAFAWGYIIEVGATSTAIGTGKTNTEAILSAFGGSGYAAAVCDSLVIGGYDDWFLPSKDELQTMIDSLALKGLGNFSPSGSYWSSSEFSLGGAWAVTFGSGVSDSNGIVSSFASNVRAIRQFAD